MNKLMQEYMNKTARPATTGMVNGRMGCTINDPEFFSSSASSDDEDTTNYEQEFVRQEVRRYTTGIIREEDAGNSLQDVDDIGDGFYDNTAIYGAYNFDVRSKKPLAIDSYKEKILGLINITNVVVIHGPTGCGKTTQVPQFILDDCREKRMPCNIVVTQPRKIATINVARRVCEERGWTMGTVCGYQVGLEKEVSPNVLITYMTTGVLLQKLIRRKCLKEYTHIIVDEIHERNQELDFLLLIIRKFLFTNSLQTKVILMSATIDAKEFAEYFRGAHIAPIIHIERPNQFSTQIFYADQLQVVKVDSDFDYDRPRISESVWLLFTTLMQVFDKINEMEESSGSVLVFLPGLQDIEEANRRLSAQNRQRTESRKGIVWEIIPLHSSLPNDEQAKAFKKVPPGVRKIILSTNIAESSITVPDVTYVIDFCLTKAMTVDPISKYLCLRLEWASHVNCEQRAGRVGRVSNGRVYRLVTKEFYQKLQKKGDPEILRAPLEQVILQSKMLDLNESPKQILALAINPPNLKNIENTIWTLKEVGGLYVTCRGVKTPSDGDITFLGTIMASLPLDVRLSKFIILGHVFSILDDTIIIAAGCSIQNIFAIPFQQRLNAYKKLQLWADDSSSDFVALLNLYKVYSSYKKENHFDSIASEQAWCAKNFVSYRGLREWNILITEIKARLRHFQIIEMTGPQKVAYEQFEEATFLKIVTCAAFYPNYFIRLPQPIGTEREACKIVGGRDPFSTIYFTGFESNHPGQLYVRAIKNLLNTQESSHNVTVGFDGSSKVYIEYKNTRDPVLVEHQGKEVLAQMSSKIPAGVYEAVRMRQLRMKFELKILPNNEAWEWAKKFGIENTTQLVQVKPVDKNCYSGITYEALPSLDTEYIEIIVTYRVDAGHFWAQNSNEETNNLVATIYDCLNRQVLHPVEKRPGQDIIRVGDLYAAKYNEDGKFYRCQVICIGPGPDKAQIRFIDYGNIQTVLFSDLFKLPNRPECHVNPIAFECQLSGIRPKNALHPSAMWSDRINELFDRKTENTILYAKVYSVVNETVHLELFLNRYQANEEEAGQSLNSWLVREGYAQVCEESYLSRENHEKRLKVLYAENPNSEAARIGIDKVMNYNDFSAPVFENRYKTIALKGPYSPLEMKVYGLTESALSKGVSIEGTSINAVLLDHEPEERYSRLLVSSSIGQSVTGEHLTLRQTCMMPNVPGFPMMMLLLFCHQMEPKLTDDGTRVAAIHCGLGSLDYSNKPCYPLHDIVLTLDTELTAYEIHMANKIRFLMNNSIKVMDRMSREMATQNELLSNQLELKTAVMNFLHYPRNIVEPVNVDYANVWNKSIADATVIAVDPDADDGMDVFPLLWFVKLNKAPNFNPKIMDNLDHMDRMARRMDPFVKTTCQLCDQELDFLSELRWHIVSDIHKSNYKAYMDELQ